MNNSTTDNKVPWGIRDLLAAALVVASLTVSLTFFQQSSEALFDDRIPGAAIVLIIGAVIILIAFAAAKFTNAPVSLIFWTAILAEVLLLSIYAAENLIDAIQSLDTFRTTALIILGHVAFFVPAWIFTRGKYNATLEQMRLALPDQPIRALIIGILIWIVALAAIYGWTWLVNAVDALESLIPPDNATSLLDQLNNAWWLVILATCISAPITEEILFRAFLLPGLSKRIGPILATIISSLVFAAIHIGPGVGAGIIIPVLLLSIALSIIYFKTRSVWICIIVHSLHNATSLAITIL